VQRFNKSSLQQRSALGRTVTRASFEPLDPRLLLSATITVNTLIDDSTPDDGVLSLREAIDLANTNAGADTIAFAAGLTGTIKLNFGELGVTDDLNVSGPGAKLLSVSGNDNSRVFRIDDFKVSISGLSIINGQADQQEDGGGIMNAGHLTLNRVILSGNVAGSGGQSVVDDPAPAGGMGGAIFNSGVLTISNSAILDNLAGRGGDGYDDFFDGGSGGDGGLGGGIYNKATLILTNCTIAGNEAGSGGFGGDGDFGFGGGGGDGGSGGGIANDGDVTLVNVTISDNYSGFGGFAGQPSGRRGQYGSGGGLYNRGFGTITIANSLVADNDIGAPTPDANGDFKSLGHNLITADDGSQGWIASDLVGTNDSPIDAKIDFVGDNGGPTPTIALLAGSPAIDAGDKTLLPAYSITTDQRGYARVYNRLPDIGAFESKSGFSADANHDGKIDFLDLASLAQNYNVTDGKRTWEQGDFNGDGSVDFLDLAALAQNYNTSPGATTAAAPLATASPVAAPELAAFMSAVTKKQPAKTQPPKKPIFSVIKVVKPIKIAPPAKTKH
jgi:CSLREA domain-containing protein